jgi:hypothetical protein
MNVKQILGVELTQRMSVTTSTSFIMKRQPHGFRSTLNGYNKEVVVYTIHEYYLHLH